MMMFPEVEQTMKETLQKLAEKLWKVRQETSEKYIDPDGVIKDIEKYTEAERLAIRMDAVHIEECLTFLRDEYAFECTYNYNDDATNLYLMGVCHENVGFIAILGTSGGEIDYQDFLMGNIMPILRKYANATFESSLTLIDVSDLEEICKLNKGGLCKKSKEHCSGWRCPLSIERHIKS